MNDLITTRLFNLIVEESPIQSPNEIKSAYEEFIKQIKYIIETGENYIDIVRTLNYTRIEFVTLDILSLNDNKKKYI